MTWRFVFIVLMVLCLGFTIPAASSTSAESVPAGPSEKKPEPVLESSPLWVVVNLFTGKSSKQAVIVRDTLARLGAEGQGVVLPYNEITIENMKVLKPAFLALSPNGIPWCKYRGRNGAELQQFFRDLRVIVEEMKVPVIGICGGHQAIALAFGGKVGPIRGGEDDCFPYGDNPTERGRHNLTVLKSDPLFDGMGETLNLVQNHYDEVKKLPNDFVCLAENKLCPYQIIRHATEPVYGVQAHTEYYLKNRPDGGILLRNFLQIAKTHNQTERAAVSKSPERSRISTKDKEKSKLRETHW